MKLARVINMSIEEALAYLRVPGAYQILTGRVGKAKSPRIKLFARGPLVCVQCGLPATHFGLDAPAEDLVHVDRHPDPNRQETWRPHLNLYGMRNGAEVLFTADHVIPRAGGGGDSLSNLQVMCGPCNWALGHKGYVANTPVLVDQSRPDSALSAHESQM